MTTDGSDLTLTTLALRLEMIADRLDKLKVQVHGLVASQTVEAKEFVVKDDRAVIRARLEMEQYAPCLTFYDPAGTEQTEDRAADRQLPCGPSRTAGDPLRMRSAVAGSLSQAKAALVECNHIEE